MYRKIFFFLLLICVSKKSISQVYPDAGLWTTLNVEKGLNARLTLLFTEEFRLKENYSRLNLFYTNLGVECKVTRNFKAALIYRWIDKFQDDNTFSYRNRLMLDLVWKSKLGKVGVAYRHRLQAEQRSIFTSEKGNIREWYSRNKFSVKYDLDKPLTPWLAAEFRYQIRDHRRQESELTWHRGRYALGVDYKRGPRSTFGIYYLVQREFNVNEPNNLFITGIEYTLSL